MRRAPWFGPRLVTGGLLVLTLGVALAAEPLPDWQTQAAVWVEEGHERPEAALRSIELTALPEGVPVPVAARWWARSRGVVAARAGRFEQAERAVGELVRLARTDPLAEADEHLVRALIDEQRWRSDSAEREAREALRLYDAHCAPASRQAALACDDRSWWRSLRLLAGRAEAQGRLVEARSLQQRALDVAQASGLLAEQAWALSSQAVLSQGLGETELARRQLLQADRLAQQDPNPEALVRVRINEARLADARGDVAGARRALEEARQLAQPLQAPRLDALLLANLSDVWLRVGRARDALAAAERALPVVRRFADLRLQAQALHNGGLARLALGQAKAARADLDAALGLWEQAGATGPLRTALRQYADALAQAGDPRAALDMLHRETRLREQMEQVNRAALLQELRQRHRAEAEQRDLDQLARDNQLKAERLTSQALLQRVWALGGVLLLMALAVLGLLVKRTRDANQQLRRSEALLRTQSQRDALTGLANRRHFRALLEASHPAGSAFEGALLLLDVDHFKRINDEHGHVAGDAVLAEVARRLAGAVRAGDLPCRWGGEEFLVHAPGLQGADLDALAQRLLAAVGDRPVPLTGQGECRVTLSIGYAAFPLPAHQLPLAWERAVNLVDMALYTAKSMGRDMAVGLLSVEADSDAALQALEAGFERARAEGRVTLRLSHRLPPD